MATNKELLERIKRASSLSCEEKAALVREVSERTTVAYEGFAETYASRRQVLSEFQKKELSDVHREVTEHFPNEKLFILDVGAGSALKTRYLHSLKGDTCFALDNTDAFGCVSDDEITFIKSDMCRVPLGDASVHFVLHCATLHHLPFIDDAECGAVQAVRESLRVLKPKGILYIVVKYGNEAFFDEVGRFIQPFNEKSFRELVKSCGGIILEMEKHKTRNPQPEWREWLHVKVGVSS